MAALEQYRPPTPMDHEESGRIDATEIESRKEAENILEILLIDVRNRYEIAERHFKGEATKMIEEHVDMLLREHAASIRLAKGVEAALKPSTKQGHSPAVIPLPSVNMGMSGSPAAITRPSATHITTPAGVSRPSVHEGEAQADHTATGDVPKQKLDRKVVQGSGNACGPVMPKSYIPEDEWVAYREWRKGLGDKRLEKISPQPPNGLPTPTMLEFRTQGFNGYAVKYSPFFDSRIAVASAANFGLVGNGRLYVLGLTPKGIVAEK
ncbi:MAG: hypothetical protein Q9201_004543, partial [Fulgogasparrea decipioides]